MEQEAGLDLNFDDLRETAVWLSSQAASSRSQIPAAIADRAGLQDIGFKPHLVRLMIDEIRRLRGLESGILIVKGDLTDGERAELQARWTSRTGHPVRVVTEKETVAGHITLKTVEHPVDDLVTVCDHEHGVCAGHSGSDEAVEEARITYGADDPELMALLDELDDAETPEPRSSIHGPSWAEQRFEQAVRPHVCTGCGAVMYVGHEDDCPARDEPEYDGMAWARAAWPKAQVPEDLPAVPVTPRERRRLSWRKS